ncbi:fumarylacetoacetase [Sphingobium algorifonticola]|uniref:fumarylacetoacetase n=1 Tax=Sphingobium algorifonticola TaxID=2008318 RepID=A0A437JAU3_9SPHN|nr:fumarylacetoacetase [Sphingobium algorifonticola]RVT42402.1 fumarylacetoacetase [Sphingobium algorifonticola]
MTPALPRIDETHDPARKSWVESANGHADFPIQNLPLGVFVPDGSDRPRIGTAIGDCVLDLAALSAARLVPEPVQAALAEPVLNALFALPAAERGALRQALSALLSDPSQADVLRPMLHDSATVEMRLPAAIGDYTDFYVGIHHATNVGRLFRPDNPLLPNYKHVPIGYHGRASSIRPSGVPVRRPSGQRKSPEGDTPIFGPSVRLDYELELGIWIGPGNALGEPIGIENAAQHIAGFCLLNDWSARDFQAWEYQPLGPFLAKNFHSTISPWVITAEALAPFRQAQPARPEGDPAPLPYLWDAADQSGGALGLTLSVAIETAAMRAAAVPPFILGEGPASNMYWTAAQIVTHHASNGCNLMPGDLLGTGTISTPDDSGLGSLLEATRGGSAPVRLPGEERRSFLEDGDRIIMRARAQAADYVPIGFGACVAEVIPAIG